MGDIEINISFPLDDDGFFRRECPFCNREFKILIAEEERRDLVQRLVDSFMIESEMPDEACEEVKSEDEAICPYCGQRANKSSLWTREQSEYVKVHEDSY
jgi:uncharacterized Zn-finger protein